MGELRDRMVRDMELRNYALRTIKSYVAGVKGLARYYQQWPDLLADEEVQRYLLYLCEERKLSVSTSNQVHCAMKFFYETTLGRAGVTKTVLRMRGEQKLPEILESGRGRRDHRRHWYAARPRAPDAHLRRRSTSEQGDDLAPR